MKFLLILLTLLFLGCATPQKPDLYTLENRYLYLMNGLASLKDDDDVGQYCFDSSVLVLLDPEHLYYFHMECGEILYRRGDFIRAGMEYLFASNQEGISSQQLYDAYIAMTQSEMADDYNSSAVFLVKRLEEEGVEYGPEAIVLNLNALMKTFPYCTDIIPLVEKLLAFEDWRAYMKEETYVGLIKKCGEI